MLERSLGENELQPCNALMSKYFCQRDENLRRVGAKSERGPHALVLEAPGIAYCHSE
jgi:hypothetical protein